MPNIKCGHCKEYHQNVAAVRRCPARHAQQTPAARAFAIADAKRTAGDTIKTEIPPTPKAWPFNTPLAMVEHMREGRYAVEVKLENKPTDWVFIRVSRPTRGKMKGSLLLQTQHSDYYKHLIIKRPGGSIWVAQQGEKIDIALMMIAADPFTSAINYGRELGCCSRCGRELTDERSRHYSIGPECEKHWPEIITYVNEVKGVFVP